MDLAEEPQRQRQPSFQQAQTMIQGSNIVADLPHLIQRDARFLIQLEQQQVGQGGLGPLDHGGEHRFLANVHLKGDRGVRQQGRDAVQSPERQQRLVDLDGDES